MSPIAAGSRSYKNPIFQPFTVSISPYAAFQLADHRTISCPKSIIGCESAYSMCYWKQRRYARTKARNFLKLNTPKKAVIFTGISCASKRDPPPYMHRSS